MNLRQINWRTGALILCLALSLALSIAAYRTSRQQLPDWIEIQEGPVAHGVDKFYRNAYFKGNIEVAGDLAVAGETDISDTMTMTTAILDKLVWQDASGGVITSTRTLTPTATYYQIDPDAGGDITITLAACTTEGQPLILYNALTRTVTISNANVVPSAQVALSQYDLFNAQCNGTAWIRSITDLTGRNGETIDNTPDGEWDFGSANLDTSGNIEGADITASGDTDLQGTVGNSTGIFDIDDMVSITGERDATTDYDYFLHLTGNLDGQASGAKTYGQFIEVARPAGYSTNSGNIDDAGLKVRVETNALTYTAGYVMSGADIEAKTEDGCTQGTLRGAQVTAVTDEDGGTDTQIALRAHAETAGVVTTTLQIGDFELNRKHATDPTNEWGLNIRNTSSSGGGADAALRIESSYGAGGSVADDNWDYCIDMEPADAAVADIRLSQGETINNLTDGVIQIGGFVALTAGDVLTATENGYVITPTASYQPINADGVYTATVADGSLTGQLLTLINQSSDTITLTEAAYNAVTGGDVELTGGAYDSLSLLWDGTNWVRTASAVDN